MNQTVYLSLGGNEGAVVQRLQKALHLLSFEFGVSRLVASSFYHTSPVEMEQEAAWFINAVCAFETHLPPIDIFEITQRIERQLGKVSKPKNAARPIDLDILFYGNQIWRQPELEIPHPRWKERLFVLVPLQELTNEIVIVGEFGVERYLLQDLITPLLNKSSQICSLNRDL